MALKVVARTGASSWLSALPADTSTLRFRLMGSSTAHSLERRILRL